MRTTVVDSDGPLCHSVLCVVGGGICMCKVMVVRFSFQPKFSCGNSKKIIVSKFFHTNTLLGWFWDLVYSCG